MTLLAYQNVLSFWDSCAAHSRPTVKLIRFMVFLFTATGFYWKISYAFNIELNFNT